MRIISFFGIIISFSMMVGCGEAGYKALADVWTSTAGEQINLAGTTTDGESYPIVFTTDAGATCQITLSILGDDNEGVFSISQDDCGAFNGSGLYQRQGDSTLVICRSGEDNCSEWH